MPMRLTAEEIEQRVSPHLPPDELYAGAFQGAEGIAARLAWRFRVVAVTDVGIHVYSARMWRACNPKRLLSSHQLDAMIERPRKPFSLAHEIVVGDRRLWVTVAWGRDLSAAMAATNR